MKQVFYISFFVCLYFCGSAQNILKTKFIKPTSDLKPGGYFSVFFEVMPRNEVFNDSIKVANDVFNDSIKVAFEFPKNWKILTSKSPATIIGKEEARYMYTFSSQSNTKSGVYPIIAKVFDSENNLLSADTCKITIQKFRKLEIIALNFPENAKEGDSLKIKYLLQNLGNNKEKVTLKVEEGSFNNVKDTLTLEPKESIELDYRMVIPKKISNYWVFNPFIKVIPIDTNVALASIFQSLPIYSTTLKKTDLYLRIPIDVGLLYNGFIIGNKHLGGFQYDIRGRGYLDFGSKHYVDFNFHGPNSFQIPIIGSYDTYSVQYKYKKNTQLNIGDYALRFNNLMEFGRFGRGFIFEQEINKNRLMAFVSIPRFSQNEKFEAGASYQTPLNKHLNLSFNYMFKTLVFNGKNEINTSLVGLSTNYSKSNLRIDTELSTGLYQSKSDIGFYNQLSYQGKSLYFNNISIYTGKDFYGFYNNSIALINTLGLRLNKVFNVTISNNYNRLNPSFDLTNFNTSPLSNTYSAFFGIRLNQSNNINLGFSILEREDRFEPKAFNYRDDFGSFGFNHTSKRVNVSLISRYGSTLNRLVSKDNGYKSEFISNTFNSEVKILKWLSIGALLDHQQTSKFSLDNEVKSLYFYGGKVGLNINKILNASVSYRNGYAPDELTAVTNNLNASVDLNFKNHSLGVTGGKTIFPNIPSIDFSNKNLTFFNIKYTFRLNAPIAKMKNLGSIKGQISGFNHGLKKDGIIVQLGERRSMTDTSGSFYFNNLLPDTYVVSIDKTTIGKGFIPMLKLPLKVEVKADSTKKIQIAMIKTGSIEGKVEFVKGTNISNEYKEKPNLIIKITDDKQTFYTQLDKNDEFSFKEIKPENWKLYAYFQDEEDKFVISNGEQSVLIKTDTVQVVNIQVKPIERKIYFSSNNYDLVAKNVKKKVTKQINKVEPTTKLAVDSISTTLKTKVIEKTKPVKTASKSSKKKTFEGMKVSLISIPKVKIASNTPKLKYLQPIATKSMEEIRTVEIEPIEQEIYFSSNNYDLVAKNAKKEEVKQVSEIEPTTKLGIDSISTTLKTKVIEKTKPVKTASKSSKKKTFEGITVSLISIPKVKIACNMPKLKYLQPIATKSMEEIRTVEIKPIEQEIYFSSNNYDLVVKNVKKEEVKQVSEIEPTTKLGIDSISTTLKTKVIAKTKPVKTASKASKKKTFEGMKVSLISIPKVKIASNTPKLKYLQPIAIKSIEEIRTAQTYDLSSETEKTNLLYGYSDDFSKDLRKEGKNRR